MKKTHMTIFSGSLARHLLKNGYIITDVKAHRNLENASVFIFRNEPGLIEEIYSFRE